MSDFQWCVQSLHYNAAPRISLSHDNFCIVYYKDQCLPQCSPTHASLSGQDSILPLYKASVRSRPPPSSRSSSASSPERQQSVPVCEMHLCTYSKPAWWGHWSMELVNKWPVPRHVRMPGRCPKINESLITE